jgi:hypothetical protein
MSQPKPENRKKSVRTTVSIPPNDYEMIGKIAESKRVSVGWVIRDAVDEYLKAHPQPSFEGVRNG